MILCCRVLRGRLAGPMRHLGFAMSADGWASFMQRLVVGGGDGRSAARFHDGQEQPGSRRRRVYRMLITWTKLEPLMAFGIILCIDALLGRTLVSRIRRQPHYAIQGFSA